MNANRFLILFLLLTISVGIPTAGRAQVSSYRGSLANEDQARQFIVQLYREYYQRNPNYAEVEDWMRSVRRGNTAEELHAAFIGSEEFFTKFGRSEYNWINNLFVTLANRNPGNAEISYWMNRLELLQRDRQRLALEFLRTQTGGRVPGPGYDPSYGTLPGIPSYENLASQLVTSSQQLAQNIRYEVSSWNGTVLQMQANSLLQTARQNQAVLANPSQNFLAAQAAMQQIGLVLQGLNSQFQNLSGANTSRIYLAQINRIHQELSKVIPDGSVVGRPTYPPLYPPSQPDGLLPDEVRRISNACSSLLWQIQQSSSIVQNLARYDYRYSAWARDIGQLAADVQNFGNSITAGFPRSQMNDRGFRIRSSIQNLGARLEGQNVDVRLSQAWYQTVAAFNQLAREMGNMDSTGGGGTVFDPGRLQALRQPIDQAIAQTDQLIYQYGPMFYSGILQSAFVSSLQGLRESLARFRSSLDIDSSQAAVQRNATLVTNSFRTVNLSWDQLVRNSATQPGTDIGRLAESIRVVSSLR